MNMAKDIQQLYNYNFSPLRTTTKFPATNPSGKPRSRQVNSRKHQGNQRGRTNHMLTRHQMQRVDNFLQKDWIEVINKPRPRKTNKPPAKKLAAPKRLERARGHHKAGKRRVVDQENHVVILKTQGAAASEKKRAPALPPQQKLFKLYQTQKHKRNIFKLNLMGKGKENRRGKGRKAEGRRKQGRLDHSASDLKFEECLGKQEVIMIDKNRTRR